MIAVLGIDAAWASGNASGVALIRKLATSDWEYVAAAPSCASFIELTEGHPVNWEAVPRAGAIEPNDLLNAINGAWPDLDVRIVAVDIPVGIHRVRAKRFCDHAIDAIFRRAWAGTLPPTEDLPGPVSDQLMCNLRRAGYPLATCDNVQTDYQAEGRKTIEVYPHPAIVRLLNLKRRLPYKDGKRSRYWPKADTTTRRHNIATSFNTLHAGLTTPIHGIPDDYKPTQKYAQGPNSLKKFEDTLDALVCAWVGACYFDSLAECFGDRNAAIWVPFPNNVDPNAAAAA